MGLSLRYSLFLSLLLTGCLPESNFKQGTQDITEEPGDGVTPPTTTSFSFSGISMNPQNSFNPLLIAKLNGNLTNVSRVLLYSTISGSTCSNPVVYNDSRNPAEGVPIEEFDGNEFRVELNYIAVPANTYGYVYAQVERVNGTKTSCILLTRYKHNLQTPINLTKVLVDDQELDSAPTHFKSTSLILKLATDISTVNTIKLYKNSCDSTPILEGPPSGFETGATISSSFISLNQINRFFARGYNNSTSLTSCIPVFYSTHDSVAPSIASSISHSAISRSTTSTPAMSWSASTDSSSGIRGYEYAIGTAANNNSVRDWSPASSRSNFIAGEGGHGANLSLSVGTYYFKIRAIDNAGNISTEASSSWRVIEESAELGISFPPESSPPFMVSKANLTVSGTCISGIDVMLDSNSGVTGPESVECSSQNTFNYPVVLTLPTSGSTSANRTITLSQDNGLSDDTISRTVNLSPLIATGASVASGDTHTCTTRGVRAFCTGGNGSGQLGISSTTNRATLYGISRGDSVYSFEQVGAGALHTCTLRANKKIYCWGSNTYKQIGKSSGNLFSSPQEVSAASLWLQIGVGAYHSCAVLWNKEVWCWGRNNYRQLGNSSYTAGTYDALLPVSIGSTPLANVLHLSTGAYSSCALLENKNIYCWGRASEGQLGYEVGSLPNYSTEPQKIDTAPLDGVYHYTDVSIGSRHACALINNGKAFCWGRNDSGALGIGTATSLTYKTPTRENVVNTSLSFKRIFAGGDYDSNTPQNSCAITTTDDKLYCWGSNNRGQLGNGNTTARYTPEAVQLPASEKVLDVSIGSAQICAKTQDRTTGEINTYCWGEQNTGRLGNNVSTSAIVSTPFKIIVYGGE